MSFIGDDGYPLHMSHSKESKTGLRYSDIYDSNEDYSFKLYNNCLMRILTTIYNWGSQLASKIRKSQVSASSEIRRYNKGHVENISKNGLNNAKRFSARQIVGQANWTLLMNENNNLMRYINNRINKLTITPKKMQIVANYYNDQYIKTIAKRIDSEIRILNRYLTGNQIQYDRIEKYLSRGYARMHANDSSSLKRRQNDLDVKTHPEYPQFDSITDNTDYGKDTFYNNRSEEERQTDLIIMASKAIREEVDQRFKEVDRLYKEFANYCKSKKYNIQDALKNRPIKSGRALPPPKD